MYQEKGKIDQKETGKGPYLKKVTATVTGLKQQHFDESFLSSGHVLLDREATLMEEWDSDVNDLCLNDQNLLR